MGRRPAARTKPTCPQGAGLARRNLVPAEQEAPSHEEEGDRSEQDDAGDRTDGGGQCGDEVDPAPKPTALRDPRSPRRDRGHAKPSGAHRTEAPTPSWTGGPGARGPPAPCGGER